VKIASLDEAEGHLMAASSDPVDFLFAPEKKPFVLYADHNQFTTPSNLNGVVQALPSQGFREVSGYHREL